MKTVNINASTNSKRIPIGRCEDNEATRVVFDCSGFSSAYGSGQATLLHRRSKEKISYIVQNITQEDNTVIWTVSSDDTAFSGEGTLQLMWTVNDVVVHSHFYTTITDPSLTDSSSEPTEVKSALQLLIDSCYTKEETDDLIAHMRAGSDWDANEGESGYIENRPFYSETVEGEEVVHQLDSKYLDGKLITSGTGENSEVFNDINNIATGSYSHAEGLGTIATASACHVGGKYNVEDKWSTYAEIIGNGTSNINRSNARTLDWSGNEHIYGNLTAHKKLYAYQDLDVNGNASIDGSLMLGNVSNATINAPKLVRLLELVKDTHWDSHLMIPDGYIRMDSTEIYTEEETQETAGYPFYYLPPSITLDAIATMDIAMSCSYYVNNVQRTMLAHYKLSEIPTLPTVLWMKNCKGYFMLPFKFYIIRKSDMVTTSGDRYDFLPAPSTIIFSIATVKTNSIGLINDGTSASIIQSMSLDWTLK